MTAVVRGIVRRRKGRLGVVKWRGREKRRKGPILSVKRGSKPKKQEGFGAGKTGGGSDGATFR